MLDVVLTKSLDFHGHDIRIDIVKVPDTVNCVLYTYIIYDNDVVIENLLENGLYYVYPEIAMVKAEFEFEKFSSDAFTS